MNRNGYLIVAVLMWAQVCLAESSPPLAGDIPDSFLGTDTIGVIRFDLNQMDAPGLADWALKTLRDAHLSPQVVEDFAEQVRGAVTKADNWGQDFKRACATKLSLVVRQPIIAKLPFVVVPLSEGSDAEKIAAQLEASQIIHSGEPAAPSTQPADEHERQRLAEAARARTFRARRIGRVVVYGNELTLDELRSGGPTTKSTSAASALGKSGKTSAGVQVLLLPDALRFLRDTFKEEDNAAPDPIEKAMLKLEWVTLDIHVGRRPGASLELHCQPGAEKTMKDAFEGALKSVGSDSKWNVMIKSLHVIARDQRVDLQLTPEDLGRLLVSAVNESASTQPTTAPTTQKQ